MTKEQFRIALAGCGCTLRDGNVYYEADDLIECLEDMKLFDSAELEPCEDCIRRSDAVDTIKFGITYAYIMGIETAGKKDEMFRQIIFQLEKAIARIERLPSVTPARKKGKWRPLEYDGYADGFPVWDVWECDQCGHEHRGESDTLTDYCPDCGAEMEVKDE